MAFAECPWPYVSIGSCATAQKEVGMAAAFCCCYPWSPRANFPARRSFHSLTFPQAQESSSCHFDLGSSEAEKGQAAKSESWSSRSCPLAAAGGHSPMNWPPQCQCHPYNTFVIRKFFLTHTSAGNRKG